MELIVKQAALAIALLACAAATLRFQHVAINEGPGIRMHQYWRVLLPFQSIDVELPKNGRSETEVFACFGLTKIGASSSESFSYTIRCEF